MEGVTGLLLAAGLGQRMGLGPKALLKKEGVSLLERGVASLQPWCDAVVVVLPDSALVSAWQSVFAEQVQLVVGGALRQESVQIGVRMATGATLLVHDVVRPNVPDAVFERVMAADRGAQAVVPVVPRPVRDSLARVQGGSLLEMVPRDGLVAIQTPQRYQADALKEVLDHAQQQGWQSHSLPELFTRLNHKVITVEGAAEQVKLTYAQDWLAYVGEVD
ncbi:IspD/TarI family cytidylyltransferase [Magnetococcus sp. PR-3]|uniref:IspD/TarI family cytidylyltransferase n=1 Tax=Magnetococcus sp. PR-3 TaxID=3120355 RepID=UPI002FCDE92A